MYDNYFVLVIIIYVCLISKNYMKITSVFMLNSFPPVINGGLVITTIPQSAINDTIAVTIPNFSLKNKHPKMLTVITEEAKMVRESATVICLIDQIKENIRMSVIFARSWRSKIETDSKKVIFVS